MFLTFMQRRELWGDKPH